MNNFGLGLILNFTDNASAGMQRATRNFQDLNSATSSFSSANNIDSALMSISYAAGAVGDELFQVGQNVTNLFTSVIGNVTQTGTAIATAQTQLATLYGSEEAGIEKLGEIKEYAKSSIFNFEDLIPSVIMLKANGIEAFDKIASSAYLAGDATSQANQTLMDYAADLAAFNPQMKNSYGTGIQAAMGALNEYIAEGNAMSLKRGASLDINQLIGEETAGTIEERSRQVADLIEKLGMVGMTANLAGTPMQRLSNVSDLFFNLMADVSDSGVFEKYSSLIAKFTDYLFSIPDEELKSLAKVIGGAITDLMTPFEKLIDVGIKAVDWIRELVKTKPELVQTAIKAIAVAGSFLLISGVVLKLSSSFGFLKTSLSGLFKGGFTNGAGVLGLIINLTRYIFPLISAVTLLKFAWDRNFLGIKDVTTETFNTLWETFNLVLDAFRDNTLSEEAFKKAQELGVLPLIEGILQLKYHWGFFVDGFKAGLDSFFNSLGDVLTKLGILKADISGFKDFVVEVINAMTKPGMTDTWEKFGEVLGKASGKLMLVFASIGLVRKALSVLGGVSSGLSTLSRLPLIGNLFGGSSGSGGNDGNGGPLSGGVLSHPTTVLKSLASATIIVGGVIGLIEVLGVLEKTPGFTKYLSSGFSVMSKLFDNLIPIITSMVALSSVVKLLDLIKLNPKSALKGIIDLGIVLGGFTAIATIVGAVTSNPDVSYFVTVGTKTLSQMFESMNIFTTGEFWGAVAAITAMGMLGGAATVGSGVVALAEIIGGIELIVAAFGALAQIPGYDEFMNTGGKALAQIFEIIGECVGSLVGGVAVGLTDGLPDIGANIAGFGMNIKPFFDAVNDAPVEGIGKFLVAFGEFVVMLGANEIMSLFSGGIDLPGIGTQLSSFATNAQNFFTIVSTLPEEGITKAKGVFEALGGIGQYSFKSGGIAQLFTGETSLDMIGEQLASFAPNGATFFNTVATYSEDGITKAKGVFEALGGLGQYSFKSGGIAQLFTGETRLDIIGEQLASFAPNGAIFFNTVATYSEDGLAKAPQVFSAIAGIGDFDMKFGGVAQLFTGETRLDIIGQQLASFAPNGAIFFNTVAGYSEEGIEKTPSVFKCLENIGDSAFKIGGIAALLNGETALDVIGEQLASFAPNMKEFINTVEGFSEKGLENGEKVMNFLTVIGDCGLKSGGIKSLFSGDLDLKDVGQQMNKYAKQLKKFFKTVGNFSKKDLEKGIMAMNMLVVLGNADVREGGLLGLVRGGFNLDELGTQLANFGPGVATFFNSVKDLSEDSFDKGNKAIKALTALNDSTFKDGGLLQAFTGAVDIKNLAVNLGVFGVHSKTFFNAVKDLDYNSFTKSTKMFEALGTIDNFSDIIISLGPNTLSRFGEELVSFVDNLATFFEKSLSISTDGFNLTKAIEPFFKAIDAFDSDQLFDISKGLDSVSVSATDLSVVLETVSSDVKEYAGLILKSIEDCINDSLTALNNFTSQGSTVGYNLMVSIANGISNNAYMITNAVQNAVDSVNVSIPDIASSTASRVYGPQKMVGLATGGYVSTTGIAVLHPNEVVVNDRTTQDLRAFLNDYKSKETVSETINQVTVTNSKYENYSNQINRVDNSNIVDSLTSLGRTLSAISMPKSIDTRTLSLNSDNIRVDETKTVEVLNNILNIITGKFDDIIGLTESRPLSYNLESNGTTKIVSVLKGLTESIGNYDKSSFDKSPLIQQDIVATEDYSEKPINIELDNNKDKDKDKPVNNDNSPMQSFVENTVYNDSKVENSRNDSSSVSNDNRVIFENGSITFNVQSENGKISRTELESCAEELMKIMSRKMQLKGMQTRK